jgi:hypothetical protein
MVVGAFVALIFVGLPLAIIGLYIASTLDRRNARPPEGVTAAREPSDSATNHGGEKRRHIIYARRRQPNTMSPRAPTVAKA